MTRAKTPKGVTLLPSGNFRVQVADGGHEHATLGPTQADVWTGDWRPAGPVYVAVAITKLCDEAGERHLE